MAQTSLVLTASRLGHNSIKTTKVSKIDPTINVHLHCLQHAGKRDIIQLKVKCDNVKRGCTWVGTVGTLEEHVAKCKFTLLPCPKECSSKVKKFTRKDLDKHLKEDCPNRDYSCEHCKEKGTYTSMINIHDKKCLKKFVFCPNGCSFIVQCQHVSRHVTTECELTVIACKYKRLGCDRELKRKDMAAHKEDDKLHLRMAMDTTVKLEKKTVELKQELQHKTVQLENKFSALKAQMNGESLQFTLTDFRKKKDNNDTVQSPSYYTSPNGYHMALRVYANGGGISKGTHVSVLAPILKGKYDAQLKWPLIGKVTFTLLNQLEDKNHHQHILELTAENNAQAGSAWGYHDFIPHSALDYAAVNNRQYLKDDPLCFRMSVEPADPSLGSSEQQT